MSTITFDTLKFARRLKEAGVPEKQAEAEAGALAEVFEVQGKELVTKDYLNTRLEKTKLDIVKWVIGSMSVLFALLKLFPSA